MGTNYYLVPKKLYKATDEVAKIIGQTGEGKLASLIADEITRYIAERYHIGKKSYGWAFHFKKTQLWSSWKDVQEKIKSGDFVIVDSYGITFTDSVFITLVEDSYKDKTNKGYETTGEGYLDDNTYWFSERMFF